MKRVSENTGTVLKAPTSVLQGGQKETIEKVTEIIFKEIKPKTSLTWERNHSLKSMKHNEYHIK